MSTTPELLHESNVLAVYGLRVLAVMSEYGVTADQVLANTGVTESALRARDGHMTALQYGILLANALQLSGDPGLAYELGLRTPLTTHGFLGYGLMSCDSLGDAIELGRRFLLARMPFMTFDCTIVGEMAILDIREAISLGPLHQFAFETFMVELTSICMSLLDDPISHQELMQEAELCFQHAQPECFERFRERLPRVRFNNPSNQIRIPALFLDKPIRTANPVTAELAIEQCERELSLMSSSDLLDRVRALLIFRHGQYPDLAEVAAQLRMSAGNLKRQLKRHGATFVELRNEARCRDSQRLLGNTKVPVERIAELVGYSDPANFTRAFRKWTGETPSAFRTRSVSAVSALRYSPMLTG